MYFKRLNCSYTQNVLHFFTLLNALIELTVTVSHNRRAKYRIPAASRPPSRRRPCRPRRRRRRPRPGRARRASRRRRAAPWRTRPSGRGVGARRRAGSGTWTRSCRPWTAATTRTRAAGTRRCSAALGESNRGGELTKPREKRVRKTGFQKNLNSKNAPNNEL